MTSITHRAGVHLQARGTVPVRGILSRERFSRVLDMFSSLEVKVLCPT